MINYHEGLVWTIDAFLLGIVILLVGGIIIYGAFMAYHQHARVRNLLRIKKRVRKLVSAEESGTIEACAPSAIGVGLTEQFLDVEMNREAILFNETEQKFIKRCFVDPRALAKLRDVAARSTHKWSRIESILSLGYVGDELALEIFNKSVFDKDEDVAYYSLLALGCVRTVESARILLDILKKGAFSPAKISSILEQFPDFIADELEGILDSPDPRVRFWAINLAARFKAARYIEKIESLTNDSADNVRSAACACLAGFGRKQSAEFLIRCLGDKVWFVRMRAVRALSAIDEAMPEIAALITDHSLLVKESVKQAMADHIDKALPFIQATLESDNKIAKKEAVEALEISGHVQKLLQDITGDDPERKAGSEKLLRAMIHASAHYGIETALASFTGAMKEKIINELGAIDRSFTRQGAEKTLDRERV